MQRTATKDLVVIIRKAVIVCAVNVLCSRHLFDLSKKFMGELYNKSSVLSRAFCFFGKKQKMSRLFS